MFIGGFWYSYGLFVLRPAHGPSMGRRHHEIRLACLELWRKVVRFWLSQENNATLNPRPLTPAQWLYSKRGIKLEPRRSRWLVVVMVSGTEYGVHTYMHSIYVARSQTTEYGSGSTLHTCGQEAFSLNQLVMIGADSQHVHQAQIQISKKEHQLQGQRSGRR